MLHSSGQVKRDDEEEVARLNREYIEEKREQLKLMREGKGCGEENAPKKKKFSGFCCLFLVAVLAVCGYVVYYFVVEIKDPLLKDYYQKKSAIEQALPQGAAELKKGIEQGEALYNETTGAAEDLNKKFDQAKKAAEDVQQTYEQVKDISDKVSN